MGTESSTYGQHACSGAGAAGPVVRLGLRSLRIAGSGRIGRITHALSGAPDNQFDCIHGIQIRELCPVPATRIRATVSLWPGRVEHRDLERKSAAMAKRPTDDVVEFCQ